MLLAKRGPLVEREQDLAILEAALTDGVRGRPAVVVIEGSAGIGKTRLLAEGRRLAHDAGARVLIARASELEGELAFGVVRQLFEATLRADGLDAVISAAASASELLNAPPTRWGPGRSSPAPATSFARPAPARGARRPAAPRPSRLPSTASASAPRRGRPTARSPKRSS